MEAFRLESDGVTGSDCVWRVVGGVTLEAEGSEVGDKDSDQLSPESGLLGTLFSLGLGLGLPFLLCRDHFQQESYQATFVRIPPLRCLPQFLSVVFHPMTLSHPTLWPEIPSCLCYSGSCTRPCTGVSLPCCSSPHKVCLPSSATAQHNFTLTWGRCQAKHKMTERLERRGQALKIE